MSVNDWLLNSDPSIRWQVMHDLTDEPEDIVRAERSRIASEGWGARLLALQGPNGHWGEEDPNPEWVTLRSLLLLRDMGLDPTSDQAEHAIALVRDNVKWRGVLPQDAAWHGKALFAGEVEPCVNGRVVKIGSYFGQDMQGVVDRLLNEQLTDGGWNCEHVNGSSRGSFHTTINVLEGLLEYERTIGNCAAVREARERGQAYLLERQLLRRLSTGEMINPMWTQFSFPTSYHYDVLRGLEYLRSAGIVPDERIAEAIGIVTSKRDIDGRWILENSHLGELIFQMDETEGKPSRWNTLRAMRVLRWYDQART